LRLHSIFNFKSNLAEGNSDDGQKDYMRNAGSTTSRIWGGIKGALGSLQHINYVGPKALNGGEVVISAGKLLAYADAVIVADMSDEQMGNASTFTVCSIQ
jgi:hypothetical protein